VCLGLRGMRMKFASGIVLSLGLLTAVAHAESFATLSHIQGEVLVNTGKGFAAVESMGQVPLKRGDKVLVREQGVASLSFPDCAVTFDKPTVFTVTDKAPCTAALPAQALVVTPTSNDSVAGEAQVVGMALSAAIVVGAGIVLVDGLTDNDDPASPN
jgi:microcystin-dependent protein